MKHCCILDNPPLLCVIPYALPDLRQAQELLEWIAELGGSKRHDCLLVASAKVDANTNRKFLDLALKSFKSAACVTTPGNLPDERWPIGPNWMFQTAMNWVWTHNRTPFWWNEPDCIWLCEGALDFIEQEYYRGGKPFMGAIVPGATVGNMIIPDNLNGCAVYPADTAQRFSKIAFNSPEAWDILAGPITVPFAHNSKLYQYFWGEPGLAPTFRPRHEKGEFKNVFTLEQLRHDAVMFHRNKDSTLIPLLRHRLKRSQRSVHISVLCYNRLDLTRQCLDTLEANTDIDYTLTITDNNSTDGTREYLKQWASNRTHIRVVTNPKNVGYKEPHDSAFTHAVMMQPQPEFFVILNNDVSLGPGWLQRAIAKFDLDARLAIVGNTGVCCNLTSDLCGIPPQHKQPPEYVEGSLLIARTSHIARLGLPLFDPHLEFIYCEDCDLSLRAREAGFNIATVDLNCRHFYSQTVNNIDPQTKQTIINALQHNLAWMRKRWSVYARRKDFRYQVLVARKHAFGDVIDTTPIIAAIKKKWPLCDIDVQSDFPDVFKGNPFVRSARKEANGARYDYRFDLNLAYERRPDLHTIDAYAAVAEVSCSSETALPALYPSLNDTAEAARLFPRATDEKWAILHPGLTNWPGKDWPIDQWNILIAKLHMIGWKTAVIGQGQGLPSATMDLRHKTSVQVLYALMLRADLFIGLDSGPSHVAQAAKTPSVVLFGTVVADRKLFHSAPVIGVQADPEIVPCVGEHHRLKPPIEHSACNGDCMKAITVDMVMDAANVIRHPL
jgi:ADP-heptose:LPS heptosyltransferase/GT2 family glycosyltransferase